MNTHHMNRFRSAGIAMLALALTALLPTSAALAQSDADLRNENQQLRRQVDDLRKELAAKDQRIQQLERELAQVKQQLADLRRGSADGGGTASAVDGDVSIDESNPLASPRAMLRKLEADYVEAFGEMDMGAEGSRERTMYQRAVERWAVSTSRKYQGTVQWTVEVLGADVLPAGDFGLTMQPIDPKTGTQLGDEFTVLVDRSKARRLQRVLERRAAGDRFVFRAVMTPTVRYNAQRLEVGTFNRPVLVGPFAEYDPALDVQSLAPAPVEDAESEQTPQSPPTDDKPSRDPNK